jgi:uncharacterized protein HemY
MHVHLAWCVYAKSRKTSAGEAIERLRKALQKQENLPLAYQYLGQIFFDQERWGDARREWKNCLEWEPKNIDAARGLRLVATRENQKPAGLGGFFSKLFKKK